MTSTPENLRRRREELKRKDALGPHRAKPCRCEKPAYEVEEDGERRCVICGRGA